MRRMTRTFLSAVTIALLWMPMPAHAEGYISPFAGVHFGNDSLEKKFVWGADAGYMGAGVFGGEIDFGWAPNPFDEPTDNHVLDLMGNLIVGIPIGGTRGPGLRPYVTGGLGMIQTKIASGISGVPDFDSKDLGFNLGAGAMGFFSDHVGLRGDVRYFRTLNREGDDFDVDVDLGDFDFWRASIGLVIR